MLPDRPIGRVGLQLGLVEEFKHDAGVVRPKRREPGPSLFCVEGRHGVIVGVAATNLVLMLTMTTKPLWRAIATVFFTRAR